MGLVASQEPRYPFVPKSNAYLVPGQFWAIPLVTGRYGCGRVLDLDREQAVGARTSFWAGLMDWCGDRPPDEADLEGIADIVHHGEAHILTITRSGGEILGHRALELDHVEPRHADGGHLYCGYRRLRPATDVERKLYGRFGNTLGFGFLRVVAEKRWGDVDEYKRRKASASRAQA